MNERNTPAYAGVRITFIGDIDGARCPIQLEIGFGDAITPAPDDVLFPTMLPDFPAPTLCATHATRSWRKNWKHS